MYQPDSLDKVVPLRGIPQSSVGAPLPFVVSDEHTLLLGYIVQTIREKWDGTTVRIVEASSPGEPLSLIQFHMYYAYLFGPPNDEAFSGHPLAARGLEPYSAAEIENSSWIRSLELMNSVHSLHDPNTFRRLRHFIFAFHDSVFECVAEGFSVHLRAGPVRDLWPEMRSMLGW